MSSHSPVKREHVDTSGDEEDQPVTKRSRPNGHRVIPAASPGEGHGHDQDEHAEDSDTQVKPRVGGSSREGEEDEDEIGDDSRKAVVSRQPYERHTDG